MRYFGKIGYGITEEKQPSVYKLNIVEKQYYGDTLRNTHRWQKGESVNDNLVVTNQISIIADSFAYENSEFIRYAEYMGHLWKVDSIDIQRPRIILSLGGVYNGPTP